MLHDASDNVQNLQFITLSTSHVGDAGYCFSSCLTVCLYVRVSMSVHAKKWEKNE